MKRLPAVLIPHFLLLLLITACGGGSDGDSTSALEWPAESDSIFTTTFTDPTNDLEDNIPDSPAYAVLFPAVDTTRLDLGVDGNYFYIKVTFNGVIPVNDVSVAASGDIEAQTVHQHDIGINIDADNDFNTGAGGHQRSGIDIFFAFIFFYGENSRAYANYNFSSMDIHDNQSSLDGELVGGGAGYNYAVARFDVSRLGNYFPRGQTVILDIWAEAESNLYHHYAFDSMAVQNWLIP